MPKRGPAGPAAAALAWPRGSHCDEDVVLGGDPDLVTLAHQDATAGWGGTGQTVPVADGSAESRISQPGALLHLQHNRLFPIF